jgi:putative transposase
MIQSDWRNDLHSYLGGIVNKLQGFPVKIGGIEDHVRLLIGLKATHCLADVLRDIKKGSSEWVHNELNKKMFSWQPGYAAFTVSPTSIKAVSSYIEKQEEHHKKKIFRANILKC